MARIQALEAELGGYLHQEVCRLAELMCCDGHNLQGLCMGTGMGLRIKSVPSSLASDMVQLAYHRAQTATA